MFPPPQRNVRIAHAGSCCHPPKSGEAQNSHTQAASVEIPDLRRMNPPLQYRRIEIDMHMAKCSCNPEVRASAGFHQPAFRTVFRHDRKDPYDAGHCRDQAVVSASVRSSSASQRISSTIAFAPASVRRRIGSACTFPAQGQRPIREELWVSMATMTMSSGRTRP